MQFKDIPQELKVLNQWVLWINERDGERWVKRPYGSNGCPASHADPKTWDSFDNIINVFGSGTKYNGIGFVFTKDDPYIGIDLDKVIDENGEISEEASEVLKAIDSYTEHSPSGRGFHIIAKGKLPGKGRKAGFLEMYDNLRYFTMTGSTYRIEIKEQQEGVDCIYNKYFGDQIKNEITAVIPPPVDYTELPDDKIIEIATNEKRFKFKDLWDGKISKYPSHSEADQALCNKLAFYTGKNAEQMDRLFRRSGLFREKWDELRGAMTYGEATIKKAIEDCQQTYLNPQGGIDFPDWREKKNGDRHLLFTSGNTEALLNHLGVSLKWDTIKRKLCIEPPNMKVLNQNENNLDNFSVYIMDQLKKHGINPKSAEILAHLNYIACKNRFNRVKEFLEENGRREVKSNAVDEYLSCFQYEENKDFCQVLMRKWFIQTIAMVFNESGAYGAEGVLTFLGGQGIGKTRSLALPFISVVPSSYYKGEAVFDTSKDAHIQLTSYWAVEFSEMIRSFKEVESLKGFITSNNDEIRLPYGRSATVYPRLTSYCGTTNDDKFLKDTHNRRFWTVKISKIDLDRIQRIDYFDFWAELYSEFIINGKNAFRLTFEEREKLEEVNKRHRIPSNEEIIILERLNWRAPKNQWAFKTSTQIAEELSTQNTKLNVRRVGRALSVIGYSNPGTAYQKKVLDGKAVYEVPPQLIGLENNIPQGVKVD